jgi:hypothetical protein
MSENLHHEEEPQLEREQAPKIVQPEAEIPEDFEDPEGKSGKWGEVVENKELGVRYREKVIELPKHRQEEMGIKRIRRRELLPPFPERLIYSVGKNGEYNFNYCDDINDFLTDGGYSDSANLFHTLEGDPSEFSKRNIERHKKEGLYFQKIFPERFEDRRAMRLNIFDKKVKEHLFKNYNRDGFSEEIPGDIKAVFGMYVKIGHPWTLNKPLNTPVFIFQNKSKNFVEYLNSVVEKSSVNPQSQLAIAIGGALEEIKRLKEGLSPNKHDEWILPIVRGFNIEPLRWCHAEFALVPTKRSLNVLFFETNDEEKGIESKE